MVPLRLSLRAVERDLSVAVNRVTGIVKEEWAVDAATVLL